MKKIDGTKVIQYEIKGSATGYVRKGQQAKLERAASAIGNREGVRRFKTSYHMNSQGKIIVASKGKMWKILGKLGGATATVAAPGMAIYAMCMSSTGEREFNQLAEQYGRLQVIIKENNGSRTFRVTQKEHDVALALMQFTSVKTKGEADPGTVEAVKAILSRAIHE